MKRLLRFLDWELKNEFHTGGYFSVMLFCYAVVELCNGYQDLNIVVLTEMFLLNYLISIIQKLVLDEEKDYDPKTYKKRTTFLIVLSTVLIVISCHCFGWFQNRSIWAEIFLYLMMIAAYITVRVIERIAKKYDTKQLNDQLMQYKERGEEGWKQ